ncbi:MAG: radical SAM protein [Candidatus Methanomethylophilaceae archaeon]|nr:radical SAM protein [Candidatus Methanomethylophilaceae archaeon]
MHFTEPVYRNPYWPTYPLLQVTQGCTHNRCRFCSMYKDVPFRMQPMETIEADLRELSATVPHARTIQLLSANPLVMRYEKLVPILEAVNRYLPDMEHIYAATRVTDISDKSVEQLRHLRELGLNEISLGVESADDWTLERIRKGYRSEDILMECRKLEEAGIEYWVTFLNGVGGRSHWREHALTSADVFSQLNPKVVGTGGLTLFPDTDLYREAEEGTFDPLDEKGLMEELLLFVENLDHDGRFITHHTSSVDLNTQHFNRDKARIVSSLKAEIDHGDIGRMSMIRSMKRGL